MTEPEKKAAPRARRRAEGKVVGFKPAAPAAGAKAAGNADVTSHVFPKLNHLFVVDPSGFPANYVNLKSFQVHPPVIRMVADWLAKRFRPGTS